MNTHGNGDHCYGNSLVADADILATRGCVEDLEAAPASRNHALLRAGRIMQRLGPFGRALGRAGDAIGVPAIGWLVDATSLALPLFEDFDFAGMEPVLPNRTLEGAATVMVGDREVEVIEVGPAHTEGDAIVHLADARVVFTDRDFSGDTETPEVLELFAEMARFRRLLQS